MLCVSPRGRAGVGDAHINSDAVASFDAPRATPLADEEVWDLPGFHDQPCVPSLPRHDYYLGPNPGSVRGRSEHPSSADQNSALSMEGEGAADDGLHSAQRARQARKERREAVGEKKEL